MEPKAYYDDLTEISGIGPSRQQWLREAFNIRTYRDLAALSVDEIESRLKIDGQIPSRKAIEAWIIQARELDNSVARENHSPTRENGWKPFASFVVEFQHSEVEGAAEAYRTAVHYVEEDTDTYWPGVESSKLCQWMLGQIRSKVRSEETTRTQTPSPEAPPVQTTSAKVKISQVRVFQTSQAEEPTQIIEAGKRFQGSMRSDEPFTFEVDFELTGSAAADIASKQIECSARSYAYNPATNTRIDLGDTGPQTFKKEEFAYTYKLPEAVLQHGDYRLWVLVTPQDALALPDFVEFPLLHVV